MRTRILTTGLLLLALTACTKEKEKEPATPAKAPESAASAVKPPESTPPSGTPAQTGSAAPAAGGETSGWQKAALDGQELFATMETSEGTIVLKLFSKDAPKTVANFVGLASGQKEWKEPTTLQKTTRPLYDGTIFHRVIPDFMIQGGDPLGNGTGSPGYRFEDEFQSGRKFDKKGILAMANAGPGTNGSQFFITTSEPQWLNNKHTIFGEVLKGYDVVEKISKVPTAPGNRPLTPVTIKKVTITDKQP
ncbi:peptidylprolyl isomerase [Hyalangium rubrum]|uniref:Peptidyl-prolyl cis-trans isomerase n=1 Tax=Hyalangium rubrum TaxID=3103134 RepID=A0ABU5GZX0_9BACT|nr:peptidylprolyl isomerase [Hyalangium sp. s54d21]MDY7226748.1 peptidylprolyl isomerase [Hyalangium sp. s54d21]